MLLHVVFPSQQQGFILEVLSILCCGMLTAYCTMCLFCLCGHGPLIVFGCILLFAIMYLTII